MDAFFGLHLLELAEICRLNNSGQNWSSSFVAGQKKRQWKVCDILLTGFKPQSSKSITLFMLSIMTGRSEKTVQTHPDQMPQNAASDQGLHSSSLIQQF